MSTQSASGRPALAGVLLSLLAPVATPVCRAQDAASVLAHMTLEQKAGQVMMCWALSREEGQEAARAKLRGWVEDVGLGGVVLSLGTADEAQRLISELQQHARVPLVFAGDFECGVAFRLEGTTHLGCNMLVGASGSERLAEQRGRVTAREAAALGFGWAFAPVVDVNSNPRNPIINVRSFGEDPGLVARLGAAFVRGCEAEGVLSCAKHFPGHGDVASDSHLVMPTVKGDRARLNEVELRPFFAAIAAGTSSIMSGHLAVPGLGEDPGVPATLSHKILHDELRVAAGFGGIIVTDALDMGGVRKVMPAEQAAVQALAAGVDVLLMPPDPMATRAAVVEAVRSGALSGERLDEAVRRVLSAKERLGLLQGRGLPAADWRDVVTAESHRALAAEVARGGITLVRDRRGLVPLPSGGNTVLVTLADRAGEGTGSDFHDALGLGGEGRWYSLHAGSDDDALAAAREAVEAADRVVAALYVRVRSYSGTIGLPPRLQPLMAAIAAKRDSVAVSFGNPYLVEKFPELSTYLCAYNAGPWTERAVAAVLRGEAPVTGRLPVTIPNVAARGGGLSYLPGRELPAVAPVEEGFPADLEARVRTLLEQAVADHAFPGAVALVARRGRVVLRLAVGRETYGEDAPALQPAALFDLASLTKVCATGPALLRLIARGALSLDTKVSDLVPAFHGPGKDQVCIRHLVAHCAGLPPFVRFYETLHGADAIIDAAAKTELVYPPGEKTVYSDLGMILLSACIAKASGQDFATTVRREVFEPLGMAGARFGHVGEPLDAVPTERSPWQHRVMRGEVHDENAYAMGGVSGHAGLFATADDVARIGLAFLGGGRGWLPAPLARKAIEPVGLVEGSSRAICWDTFVPGHSGGSKLSPAAFGHTGFTGTSVWCDPATDLCLVLLTNRVYPTRKNSKIQGVRRAFADLVAGLLP